MSRKKGITPSKKEFRDLKVIFDALADKHEVLERKHEQCGVGKKADFECVTCKKKFDSRIALEKNNKIHKLDKGTFKCDGCERLFNEEWKMNAHKKTHIKHVCDECDQIFKF